MILTKRDLLLKPATERRRFWDEIDGYVAEQYLGIRGGAANFLIVFRYQGRLWGFKDWNADVAGCGWDDLSEDDPIECYPVRERMIMTYEVMG